MRDKGKLTHNAIMYASVGFQQQCTLQVLNLRPGENGSLEMVVYDGTVYAGAHYNYLNDLRLEKYASNQLSKFHPEIRENNSMKDESYLPRQLDVIRAETVLHDKTEPLQLRKVQILARGQVALWGNQVLSLDQYMKRRRFISFVDIEEEEDMNSQPSKRVKSIIDSLNLSEVRHEAGKQLFEEVLLSKNRLDENQFNLEINNNQEQENNISKSDIFKRQHTNDNSNRSAPETKNHGIIPNTNEVLTQQMQKESDSKGTKKLSKVLGSKNSAEEEKIDGPAAETIKLLFAEEQLEKKEEKQSEVNKNNIIDLIEDCPPSPPKKSRIQSAKIEKSAKLADMMISELYERMHRFRILCRINHITHFISQRGTPCTKMILIDQKGEEVLCMIYDKGNSSDQSQSGKVALLRGRTYLFENGQVNQDEGGYLNIVLSWSGIQQTKMLLPSFHPDKMMRVSELENIPASHYLQKAINTNNKSINTKRSISKELHVCGIFKGFRDQPKLINNQFRITGILCDPEPQKSVNFNLYLDELTSFPLSGTVISLHNMHLYQNERTYKLDQSKRSYYIVEQNNTHKYFADLIEASSKQTWKQKDYSNMSEIKYVPRSIGELKSLLSNMLEQDQCYSEIDCNIASLKEKRQFPACASCLHDIKAEKGTRTYCYHCKKIQRTIKRFVFTSEVADSTGSIVITIFSQQITAFINTTAQDYAGMSNEDRAALLELSSFQNILLRVKSQQQVGGATHLAIRAEKNHHRRGLDQIKEQSITKKTKYLPPWL